MLNIAKDIQSLTTFRRRSGDFIKQLKKSKRPVILTVKGKAAAVVQDPEAYQHLLDLAAGADANEGIRQGLEDSKDGRIRPAREFFDEFESHAWRISLRSPPVRSVTLSAYTRESTPMTPMLLGDGIGLLRMRS
jgi:prevent-host-death family protein